MNIEYIRSLFPVTKETIYLNSASQAPLNKLVHDRLQNNLLTELNPIGKKAFNRCKTRDLLANLLGGSPEEYALVTSTGIGINIVAQGLELKKGDNIVVPEREHWNNTFPWMQLEEKGIQVRFAKLNNDNSIDPLAIKKLLDDSTRLVAIAAVRYNSGFRPNLAAIGKIAHSKGALFMVDAAQAAGMVPIDINRDHIDIMAGCGFKWLLGMHGTGFLYVSKRASKMIQPVLPGMFAADNVYNELSYHDDARKYETGTLPYTLFDAWNAGLELVLEIGVDTIYKKALEHTDLIIKGLQEKAYHIITPIKIREERTAIVHFNAGSYSATKALYEKLNKAKVLVTLQKENIRVSPNFFTTANEIKAFLEVI